MVPGKGIVLRMTKQAVVARLRTPGVLAADLDVPLHRVLYILQTRDHIKPSARAGRLRLYDREAMALILLDHDDAGEKYAKDVAELARKAGARSVRVVRLADRWPDLPAGGDMADVLELAGGDAHAVRAVVEELTDAAEPEDPPTPSGPARFALFPVDVLPEPARALVVCGARALQTDLAMVALGVLAILAAAIGNARTVELVPGWREPAVLCCAEVAPRGTRKSPALKLATEPAEARDRDSFRAWREARDEYETAKLRQDRELSVWKRSKSADNDPRPSPEPPACERFVVDDVTIEALAATLAESPRGVLLSRDELAAWLGSFTRYASAARAGGEDGIAIDHQNKQAEVKLRVVPIGLNCQAAASMKTVVVELAKKVSPNGRCTCQSDDK